MSHWKEDKLSRGETFETSEKGNSMTPRINSGQKHILAPCTLDQCEVNDMVFCKVRGRYYTHIVKAKDPIKGVQIGNNHGKINGWTKNVFGKVTQVL